VALQTLGGVGVLVERNGMNGCECAWRKQHDDPDADPKWYTKTRADVIKGGFAEAGAFGKQSHGDSDGGCSITFGDRRVLEQPLIVWTEVTWQEY
jgi:hypothetical protein